MILKFDVRQDLNVKDVSDACKEAERQLATQIMKDTRPFVPALTMSQNNRTIVIGNNIVYQGPYARYLYNGVAMVDAETGRGPFYIKEVGFRFRRGASLVPTNRPLNYTKSPHPQAQARWFEASKKKNLGKWIKDAEQAVKDGL